MYQKIRSGGPGGRTCYDFTMQTSLVIPIPIKIQWFWPSSQVVSAVRFDAGRAGQTLEVHWRRRWANAPGNLVKTITFPGQLPARGGLVRAKLYNRVAVTALAGIPRGQPSSKLTSKRAGTPRRWLRALQCRSDAPSMSVPGQRWSDRERLGSSMLTDIGGAAHTNTSHSSQLNPMSPTRCSATLDICEVNFDEGCSFENVSLLVLPILRSDFQLSSCDASALPSEPPPQRRRLGRHASEL